MATDDSLKLALAEIEKRLQGFSEKEIHVGVLSGAYENGTSIAYVAAIQEFGAPARSIPARPFIRPTVEKNKTEWAEGLQKGAKAVLHGTISAENVLNQIGGLAAGEIRETISSIQSPALSPVTLMLRKMRSENPDLVVGGKVVGEAAAKVAAGEDYGTTESGAKPLVDSGTLLQAISHDVVNK